jgi:hypothetical protein
MYNDIFPGLQVEQYSSGATSLAIKEKLNGRGKFKVFNTPVL